MAETAEDLALRAEIRAGTEAAREEAGRLQALIKRDQTGTAKDRKQ